MSARIEKGIDVAVVGSQSGTTPSLNEDGQRRLVLKEHLGDPANVPSANLHPLQISPIDEASRRLEELESSRRNLAKALEDMEARDLNRTSELEAANEALQAERTMLENKNIALKEVLHQIDDHKRQAGQQLQTNVNRVVRPILHILADKLPPQDHHLIGLLDSTLRDLMDPFVGKIAIHSIDLTKREIEVSNMIRNGFTSKQIASVLQTSICTVNNQRRSIRKKFRIDDGHTNLESFLKNL
ncbi:MAG: LuxR C-terminal-related transcriptional regulator [candidate division Zixibacteria bacterium]|nr:LuxR C-terminal-related transcriptional regulator [candidate division Zixibacteria bacterium]